MRIADIRLNDVTNGSGIVVSLWYQGCPHKCKDCFNPETWDFEGGKEVSEEEVTQKILKGLAANGIQRNFSLLGGDPLAEPNRDSCYRIVSRVRLAFPNIKIFLWTGYLKERLDSMDYDFDKILTKIDYLIDGPFVAAQKDITLKLRGSKNQRIWKREKGNHFIDVSQSY